MSGDTELHVIDAVEHKLIGDPPIATAAGVYVQMASAPS